MVIVNSEVNMKRKDDRNQAILEYCANSRMTLRDVGMQFGITKQRVWAIRKAYQSPQDGRQGVSESWLVRCYKSVMKTLRRGE